MARVRDVHVWIPVVPESDGGRGVGVVAVMGGLFVAVVVFAVVVCVVVSCTDFGPGSTIPTGGGCAPFCTATTAPGVAR